MNYTNLLIAIIIAVIAWTTFASLNTLNNASKPEGCCSTNDCGDHQMDVLVWWAHLGLGVLAAIYVLFAAVSESYFAASGKKLTNMV